MIKMIYSVVFGIAVMMMPSIMPFAFADKTVTIDGLSSGDFTITPDPLYVNTGERVTFHATDSALVQCDTGFPFTISIRASDVFPDNSSPMSFTPTSSNPDFTTEPFEWPPSISTYPYTVGGDCVVALAPVFSTSAVFEKGNFIVLPECVVTNSCGFSFSFPDECELISGEPCVPEIPGKELPDLGWGPICLTCPPEIQTQFGLVYSVVLDQKISSLGNTVQNMQLANTIIIGLVSIAIVLGAVNLFRSSRKG